MVTALVLVLGFLLTEGVGYLIHRVLHARWSGPLWRSHMTHHLKTYPPKSPLSDGEYRDSGKDSAIPRYLVAIAAVAALVMWLLPLGLAVLFIVEMVVIALVNDRVHAAVHIRGSWLERFRWFWRLRASHILHHRNMKKNFGVLTFWFDRAVGTYRQSGR